MDNIDLLKKKPTLV